MAFSRESGSASRSRPRAVLRWLAEGSATVRINIISVINIKSALLCFAPGGVPKLRGPGRRSPWPFTKPIIYFGEFLRYCFVRANQGWVTNDPSGVVGSPSVSGTRGQTHFWKFHVNYSRPWLVGESGLGWRNEGVGQTGVMAPLPPSLGWGHNNNKCPRAKIRHDSTFDRCIKLRLQHEKEKYWALKWRRGIDFSWCICLIQLVHLKGP